LKTSDYRKKHYFCDRFESDNFQGSWGENSLIIAPKKPAVLSGLDFKEFTLQ
jgi:hypothetical protein